MVPLGYCSNRDPNSFRKAPSWLTSSQLVVVGKRLPSGSVGVWASALVPGAGAGAGRNISIPKQSPSFLLNFEAKMLSKTSIQLLRTFIWWVFHIILDPDLWRNFFYLISHKFAQLVPHKHIFWPKQSIQKVVFFQCLAHIQIYCDKTVCDPIHEL